MPSMARLQVLGLEFFYKDFQAGVLAGLQKAVTAASRETINEVRGTEGLSKYPFHKYGTPTPSPKKAPYGENPPARITGLLQASIEPIGLTRREGFGVYSREVGSKLIYAWTQEVGNPRNWLGPIPARPYLGPGLLRYAKDRRRIESMFTDKIEIELRKRGRPIP